VNADTGSAIGIGAVATGCDALDCGPRAGGDQIPAFRRGVAPFGIAIDDEVFGAEAAPRDGHQAHAIDFEGACGAHETGIEDQVDGARGDLNPAADAGPTLAQGIVGPGSDLGLAQRLHVASHEAEDDLGELAQAFAREDVVGADPGCDLDGLDLCGIDPEGPAGTGRTSREVVGEFQVGGAGGATGPGVRGVADIEPAVGHAVGVGIGFEVVGPGICQVLDVGGGDRGCVWVLSLDES
jgi:hypothetical protein